MFLTKSEGRWWMHPIMDGDFGRDFGDGGDMG